MELTQEVAGRYVGGQLEAQNSDEGYLYRGEIAAIAVDGEGSDATLKVTLNWNAKGVGFPPVPNGWVKDDRLTYSASLMIFSVTSIGDDRILLHTSITRETVVLYPPGGSKLDPSNVKGLNIAAEPAVTVYEIIEHNDLMRDVHEGRRELMTDLNLSFWPPEDLDPERDFVPQQVVVFQHPGELIVIHIGRYLLVWSYEGLAGGGFDLREFKTAQEAAEWLQKVRDVADNVTNVTNVPS